MGTPKRGRKGRRPRGEGAVFYSASKKCWVWRAVTGQKPDGKVAYTEGRARTQAEAVERKRAAEKTDRRPDAARETVGEFLDYWLADVAKPNTRPNTWRRYEQVVRLHLKPRIGPVRLRELTVRRVTQLWADLSRAGCSPGNLAKCSQTLGTAMEVAVVEGKIPRSPTRGAAKPRVIAGEVEVFTDAEVKAVIAAAKGYRYEALILLAIGTGARQSEILVLEDTDFDLAAGEVRITKMLDLREGGEFVIMPPKTKNGTRTVSLPEFVVAAVRAHLDGRAPGPIFTTASGGYVWRASFTSREWPRLLKKAGVPYRRFHVLRHTHASRLIADGVDVLEVAKRLGDTLETIMDNYAHWMPNPGRGTAARIDAIYGGKRKRA